MSDKSILVGLLLVLVTPFVVSYSPDLAVRKELFFKHSPVSAFSSEVRRVCCSDPSMQPVYEVSNSSFRLAVGLERTLLGNWRVSRFPEIN